MKDSWRERPQPVGTVRLPTSITVSSMIDGQWSCRYTPRMTGANRFQTNEQCRPTVKSRERLQDAGKNLPANIKPVAE